MYYHIRLGKFYHGGGEDMPARKEWDFRSLNKALAFVKRDFGPEAEAWRIEDLTERTSDLMTLEKVLADALESGYQYLIMSFKDGSTLAQKYDHYQFFVTTRDEGDDPAAFSFSEEEEAEITASETVFQPDYSQSVRDILKSFDLEARYPEFLDKTAAIMAEYRGDEPDDPEDVGPVRIKDPMSAAEDIELADEYRRRGEDQIAVMLYLAAVGCDGPDVKIGEALAKMAELYLDSNLPKEPGRERDVMKAVDLLVESANRGYADASQMLNEIRAGRVK